ncbi:hypothetical protein D9619_011303 [Psilocybe cf. subviscida]|uniref:Uncharacterized protein n=1 Tax=Psilocybe cf. subviscida TaxID=2480587 RepID=A0A8H5BJT2_9AGAR|nr:hypothetical protein D9619_011303 [Psilocybe cf. subviscida]
MFISEPRFFTPAKSSPTPAGIDFLPVSTASHSEHTSFSPVLQLADASCTKLSPQWADPPRVIHSVESATCLKKKKFLLVLWTHTAPASTAASSVAASIGDGSQGVRPAAHLTQREEWCRLSRLAACTCAGVKTTARKSKLLSSGAYSFGESGQRGSMERIALVGTGDCAN